MVIPLIHYSILKTKFVLSDSNEYNKFIVLFRIFNELLINIPKLDMEIYIKSIIKLNNYNLVGDVVEFGTFTGNSTKTLALQFPDKTIFTIDHFQGLEQTNKNIPNDSDWIERAFALDNPLFLIRHNHI